MSGTRHIVAIAVALVLSTLGLKAQSMIGLYSSSKGQGISAMIAGPNAYALHDISLYADMTARFQDNDRFVGAMLNYSLLVPFYKASYDNYDLYILGGPGVSMGYVKDIDQLPGVLGALSGAAGVFFDFERRVSICISNNVNLGMHVHRNEHEAIDMSFYRAGILHSLLPQVSILIAL